VLDLGQNGRNERWPRRALLIIGTALTLEIKTGQTDRRTDTRTLLYNNAATDAASVIFVSRDRSGTIAAHAQCERSLKRESAAQCQSSGTPDKISQVWAGMTQPLQPCTIASSG